MYYLKNKDVILGELDLDNFTFKAVKDIVYLPYPLYPPGKDSTYIPTKEDVINFCKSRVMQEDNQGVKYTLEELGWNSFQPIRLCKLTKCMKLDDFLWIIDVNDTKSKFDYDHMRGKYYKGELL